jgi:hypothetical protein
MSHVTPKRTQRPRADRLMKTQEAFSYSLWRNILRKESTFRDFIFHIPNGYKERPINESPRNVFIVRHCVCCEIDRSRSVYWYCCVGVNRGHGFHLKIFFFWNHWAKLNQILLGWSLGDTLSKLWPTALPSIQDGCCSYKHLTEILHSENQRKYFISK